MDIKVAATAMRPFVEKCKISKEDLQMDKHSASGNNPTGIHHLLFMIKQIESGEVSGEKAHRWLGWIQGVVCCRGGATLEEMKAINFAA